MTDRFTSEPENNNYEEEYSSWKKEKPGKSGSDLFKKPDGIPFLKFGIGLLILLLLLILLFSRNRNAVLENRIVSLENRLTRLEESMAKYETINDRVTQIWEQAQTFEQFKERFDRSEASLTSRVDHIMKNLDMLHKQIAKERTLKTKSSKARTVNKKTTGKRYHIVKPGETLYKIGRKYGLTVEKLRYLNKLASGGAIHPGQKLLVSP